MFTRLESIAKFSGNNSAQVSWHDRKKSPTHGTNQIPGFEEFRPLTNSDKIISIIV